MGFPGAAGVVLLALGLAAAPISAAELRVKPGESIGAAIAMARPGDTVLVERGRYEENLVVDKPLTLRGIGRPTVSGGLQGDTIRVLVPDVAIEDLIVTDSGDNLTDQNAGISIRKGAHRTRVARCTLAYNLFGVWIMGADGVEVRDSLITGKRDYASAQRGNGIQLYNSMDARIVGNRISFVRDGIYVDISHRALFRGNRIHDSRYGTHYMNSNRNVWEDNESYHNRGGLALMQVRDQVVRGNRAWGNSDHGIMLRTIQDSVIEDNVVAGNQRGFFIYDAEHNKLLGNLVIDNQVGVHLWAGSIHNEVEGNDFIGNRQQIRYVASRDEPWGVRKGNYWSNYLGWDRDGNGIGDLPYEAADAVDRLTWRQPAARLLLASPAVETLRVVARQFPLLRPPSVVDGRPHMRPNQNEWSRWLGRQRH